MTDGTSVIARVLTWVVVGLVAIVALKLALWVAGMAFGLAITLLFTIGPIVLVGWLIVKVFRLMNGEDDYREA